MNPQPHTIGDVADLVRSKNAGPFWLTLEMFCNTDEDYNCVADPAVITADRIAGLYRVAAGTVKIFRLPALRVIRIPSRGRTRKAESTTATCTAANNTSLCCDSRCTRDRQPCRRARTRLCRVRGGRV